MRPRALRPGWIVAALLVGLLLAAVLGDNGVLQLWRLQGQVEALHRQVQALEAENERLARAIAELRNDPAVIERLAREELGLVRPGERVLRFPRTPRPEGAPAGAAPDPPAP